MKKLIVTGGSDGGPTTYTGILKKYLPEKGIDVEVLPFDKAPGPKIIRNIAYIFQIAKAASGDSIIYTRDPVSTGFPALLASKIKRKPLLLKVVGDYAWEQGRQRFGVEEGLDDFLKKGDYSFGVKLFRFLQRAVARASVRIIVPSEYLKKVVIAWGIDERKIEVIPNSFNKEHLPKESKEDLRKELKWGDEKVLISVGRMVPWKGFEKLIEAYERIEKETGNARLLIIGDGPDLVNIKEKALTSEAENIEIIEKLPHEDLMKYIKTSDVFVLNTGYEGLSHLLLEASALGTPITTTTKGGNKEIFENEKTATFFEYDNVNDIEEKVLTLLTDNEKQERLSKAALRLSEQYKESNMVNATIELLSGLWGKK